MVVEWCVFRELHVRLATFSDELHEPVLLLLLFFLCLQFLQLAELILTRCLDVCVFKLTDIKQRRLAELIR